MITQARNSIFFRRPESSMVTPSVGANICCRRENLAPAGSGFILCFLGEPRTPGVEIPKMWFHRNMFCRLIRLLWVCSFIRRRGPKDLGVAMLLWPFMDPGTEMFPLDMKWSEFPLKQGCLSIESQRGCFPSNGEKTNPLAGVTALWT